MNRRVAPAFALIGILWGSAWIPTTEILKEIPVQRAGALRFVIAAVFTGILALIQRLRPGPTPARTTARLFRDALILSITALALPYAIAAWVSPWLSPGLIPVLFAFMPLVALLISSDVLSSAIPALVIGISAVVLLVAQGLSFRLAQAGGILLLFCAVVLGAFSLNYAKKHVRTDLLFFSSIQFAFAAILLGTVSLATERTPSAAPIQSAMLWLLVLGIGVSGLTLPLLYWLLTRIEAWQAALLQWISTLIAVFEAALLLRVRPSAGQVFGAVLILGALSWLLRLAAPVTSPVTTHTIPGPEASDSEVGSE